MLTQVLTIVNKSLVKLTLTSGLLFHSFFVLVCDGTETITHLVGEDDGGNGRLRHDQTLSHKSV